MNSKKLYKVLDELVTKARLAEYNGNIDEHGNTYDQDAEINKVIERIKNNAAPR